MSLALAKKRLDRGKFIVRRAYPEVGTDDGAMYLMDVEVSGKKVALIVAQDEESGPAPYRVLTFTSYEVVNSAQLAITAAGDWPLIAWQFEPVKGDDVKEWDRLQVDYDDYDEAAPALARQMLGDLAPAPEAQLLQQFSFVTWRSNVPDAGWTPAGVVLAKPDRSGVVAVPFFGFESDALAWSERFDQVSPDILAELSRYAGRTEDIGLVSTVKASSFEDALDRAKYEYAKTHYAETGRSLYS